MGICLLEFGLCVMLGLVCFGIFYRCVDWFEQI